MAPELAPAARPASRSSDGQPALVFHPREASQWRWCAFPHWSPPALLSVVMVPELPPVTVPTALAAVMFAGPGAPRVAIAAGLPPLLFGRTGPRGLAPAPTL